jgi:hypothetical protein
MLKVVRSLRPLNAWSIRLSPIRNGNLRTFALETGYISRSISFCHRYHSFLNDLHRPQAVPFRRANPQLLQNLFCMLAQPCGARADPNRRS